MLRDGAVEREEPVTVRGHALLPYLGAVRVAGTVSGDFARLADCAISGARGRGFGCQFNDVQPSAFEKDRGSS